MAEGEVILSGDDDHLAHRQAREAFAKAQDDGRKLEALEANQALWRERAELAHAALVEAQRQERAGLAATQLRKRSGLRARYQDSLREREERQARLPEEVRETSSDL